MSIRDYWAFNYRNARGLAVVAAMLVAILSMLSLRCDPMIGRDNVLGLVLEVEAENLHPFGGPEPQSRILMATPDSVDVRLFLPPPVPRPGDFIPLIAEHYKKGGTHYALDQERWRGEGPQ